MNSRQWFFSGVAFLLQVPFFAYGAGLVPCGGTDEPACQTCYALGLINSVNSWLVGILSIAAAIMFIIAGFRIVTAQGNPSVLKSAKDMITNVAIGFMIVLAAWLFVDFLMKTLLDDGQSEMGPWNTIACVDQPNAITKPDSVDIKIVFPTPGQSRGTAFNSGTQLDPAQLSAVAGLSAPDDVVAAAAAAAGLDATQTRNIQALMRVESGGCRNLVSPVGALGCMQIMPGTAKQYDSSLRGLSEAQVRERLMDQNYNISLGVEIYADLYERNNSDAALVFAAYNGGQQGALGPSTDCPGQMRYECVWDSPGCYGTARTDCTPNTGYIETRNYVEKVSAVASQL
jgi:hypothetical protein